MRKCITIRPWETNYPRHLELKTGEIVKIEKKEKSSSKWKDWIWCETSTSSGWVPKLFIERIDETSGTVLQDYSAKELTVATGEMILYEKEFNGWVWGRNEDTKEFGWLPIEILLEVE